MGTAIVPVLSGSAGAAPDAAALARFCAIDAHQGLTPAAAHLHAADEMVLLERDGAAEGRCSLWWRRAPSLPGQRLGVIGHFAVDTADAAARLLDFACTRLRAAGCSLAIGPMDGSTWRRYRLITWRGSDPLFFLEPDNPDAWPAYFAAGGFAPFAQYVSCMCDDLEGYPPDAALDARLRHAGFRTRALDLGRLDAELSMLWRMACDAFADNFLYTPISELEFRQMYAPAVESIRPELMQIAEHGDTPVAFLFAVPDLLQERGGGRIDSLILKTLGVAKAWRKQGIGDWLVDGAFEQARALGFRKGIFALIHEGNVSRKMGHGRMRDMRRYTLFARSL